jgi:hypothetical protein
MLIRRSGSSTGSGLNTATLMIAKITAHAPIPRADEPTAIAVNPGVRRIVRMAKRAS